MATQTVLADRTATQAPATVAAPTIEVPLNFNLQAVDARLLGIKSADSKVETVIKQLNSRAAAPGHAAVPETQAQRDARLGCLTGFQGTFEGTGFNMIFRPGSQKPMDTTFKPGTQGADDNTMEVNLTKETLQFTDTLGAIPNRGLSAQPDINLSGVAYVQSVSDVTNLATGKGDAGEKPIHFEPGMWILTPATVNPSSGPMLARMASIPHGTTINLQGPAPNIGDAGVTISANDKVDITPFTQGGGTIPFNNMTASDPLTRRLPQDLSAFIKQGTITNDILNNPNSLLVNVNADRKITKTTKFTVSAGPRFPNGSGTIGNINMLGPNAMVSSVSSTFWVSKVEYQVEVKKGTAHNAILSPKNVPKNGPVPKFQLANLQPTTTDKTITVSTTQIQSSQTVILDFNGLSWPHISVSTLVPKDPIQIAVPIVA